MKDYSILDGMIEKHTEHLKTAYDKGYKQGCEDGFIKGTSALKEIQDCNKVTTIAEQYFRGLNDAWECIKKLYEVEWNKEYREMGFDAGDIDAWWFEYILYHYSAPEAIAKIKEYKDKQKICKTCKHDGFICDECENNSMYEPMPIKRKYCMESQILEDEYCKYPNLKCSDCPVKKGK